MRSEARVWLRPRLLWALAALLAVLLVVALTVASEWMAREAEPMVRAALIRALQQRFGSRVELDGFHFARGGEWLGGAWLTGSVEIDGLRIWLPEPEAGNAGQAGKLAAGAAQPWFLQPWIEVDRMRFRVATPFTTAFTTGFLRGGLLRIREVQIDGVRLRIPPRGYRPRLTAGEPASALRKALPRFVVEQVNCSQVWLEMERGRGTNAGTNAGENAGENAMVSSMMSATVPATRESAGATTMRLPKPRAGMPLVAANPATAAGNPTTALREAAPPAMRAARQPLQFRIASLVLRPEGGPIRFDLRMTNPRPVGEIHAVGVVGPWPRIGSGGEFDPGALALSGSYSFDHADLATVRGIAGRLDSTGSFRGILRQVEVSGQTRTPDFRLTRHGAVPPVAVGLPLSTRFTATVNGTNGDTVLHSVEATLGRSHMWASGRIVRVEYRRAAPGQATAIGHHIQLALRVDRGQIADLLQVATADEETLLTGAARLDCTLHLPPGEEPFRERLEVDGQLQASGVEFTRASLERKITELSLRGQGRWQAQSREAKSGEAIAPVTSTMTSHFRLDGGVLALPDLNWAVPGARIRLHGTYTLEGGALDFAGDASTQAVLSKMVGGWKGWLLKPMDRLFAKNGAGTEIPIRLDGTREAPHFAIELNRLGRSEPSASPDAPSGSARPER